MEFVVGEIAFEFSVDGEADVAGFFADDDGDGVTFFCNADAGPVAETERAVAEFLLADGENAGGRGEAFVADDEAAVVQGGLGVEDGEGEFLGEFAIDGDAGVEVFVELDIPLDGEKGTGSVSWRAARWCR